MTHGESSLVWAFLLLGCGFAILLACRDTRRRLIGIELGVVAGSLIALARQGRDGAPIALVGTIVVGGWVALATATLLRQARAESAEPTEQQAVETSDAG